MQFQEERQNLAAALRWAAKYDLHEGIDNHFSLEVGEDRYLINPWEVHWSEVKASDVLVIDGNGNVLEGDHTIEATAFYIHRAMHRMNPHAKAILHTHMPYITALASTEGGRLEMVSQNAIRFYNRIAYDDDYNGLGDDDDEGSRMASKLGNNTAMVMANHGVICAGPTVGIAFDDLYFLEKAAKVQVIAESTGRPLKPIPEKVVESTAQAIREQQPNYAESHWKVLCRMLAKESPEYLQ